MGGSSAGIPLAKILPKVVEMGPRMLEEPSQNMFVRAIGTLPQVELFYTLVYTNNPSSQRRAELIWVISDEWLCLGEHLNAYLAIAGKIRRGEW